MKTIKDAVIELSGLLPTWTTPKVEGGLFISGDILWIDNFPDPPIYLCKKPEFEACAKRMSYINGYEWGKEYPTNGKRPDFPKDTRVSCKVGGEWEYDDDYSDEVDYWNWPKVQAFKVLDPRYKPADTGYLDEVSEISENKPDAEFVSESLDCKQKTESVSEWFEKNAPTVYGKKDESNWHERGEFPPVGAVVCYHEDDGYAKTGYMQDWIEGDELEILSHKTVNKVQVCVVFNKRTEDAQCLVADCMRQIRTEREKVIEAAFEFLKKDGFDYDATSADYFDALYNAGMLVLPPRKSDTKD